MVMAAQADSSVSPQRRLIGARGMVEHIYLGTPADGED
jgi:hypothetical protein